MTKEIPVKRVALYVRVSTNEQTVDNQILALQEVAERMGWYVTHIFKDEGISGSKGRDQRPAFDQLCKGITRKEFDMVASWSVDRLGRSLQDLVGFLSDLQSRGVDLYLHQQGIDTSTPTGKMMFQMLGVFAEFERTMIQERICAGLERARRSGKTLGRPKLSPEKERAIVEARKLGKGIHKIAKEIGCGVGAVQRVLAEC
jgi:DNA invertase Pin-like site-specific DNA recombinase